MPADKAPTPATVADDVGMKRFIALAKEALVKAAGVPADGIEVVEARYATWPDGSAGCPEPGKMYPQVLTNGTLIRLRADGKTYRFHSGKNRPPFLCSQPATEPLDYEHGEK